MADKVGEGARQLLALLKNFDRVKERVQWVLDIRHEGDEITTGSLERSTSTAGSVAR